MEPRPGSCFALSLRPAALEPFPHPLASGLLTPFFPWLKNNKTWGGGKPHHHWVLTLLPINAYGSFVGRQNLKND